MAKSFRASKRSTLRYFFLNGEHHKVLRISRAEDLLTAWNYVQDKRCTYIWSSAQREMQKAFTLKQVCRMFNRHRLVMHEYIREGKIRKPAQIYAIDGIRDRPGKYVFSEDDLRDLHSYLLTVHRGRPRTDGGITPANLMSRAELEALMREDRILYTKADNGEFLPVWKQPDW